MDAVVVGKKLVDFEDEKGKAVKMTKFFINMPEENVEGYAVGSVSWNEIRNGASPEIALGDVIEVEYNKNGRLQFPSLRNLVAAKGK